MLRSNTNLSARLSHGPASNAARDGAGRFGPAVALGAIALALSACSSTSSGTANSLYCGSAASGANGYVVYPSPSGTPAPRHVGQIVFDATSGFVPSGTYFNISDPSGNVVATATASTPSPLPSGLPTPAPGASQPAYLALIVPELPASTAITVNEITPPFSAGCDPHYYLNPDTFTTGAN